MFFPFEQKLEQSWPPLRWKNRTVLLAVSGGADSVAMACALAKISQPGEGRLALVHYNHQLRNQASTDDELFVKNLATLLNVDCYVGTSDVAAEAQKRGDGIEEAARFARYQFFQHQATQIGARYLATAHTADDQVETVLQRIIRGTGTAGLAGIQRARELSPEIGLIRPLLKFTRSEIIEYLQQINQAYRDDESNTDKKFTRNRVRHQLLPLLREEFSKDVDQAILRLATLAAENKQFMQSAASELLANTIEETTEPEVVCFNRSKLTAADRYLIQEMIVEIWDQQGWARQDLSHEKIGMLVNLLFDENANDKQPAHLQLPGNIQAKITQGQLRLKKL